MANRYLYRSTQDMRKDVVLFTFCYNIFRIFTQIATRPGPTQILKKNCITFITISLTLQSLYP